MKTAPTNPALQPMALLTWPVVAGCALIAAAASSVSTPAAIAWVVLLPLVVEWTLREGLQSRLMQCGALPAWTIAAPALLFAMGHWAARGELWAAMALLPGLAIGFLYARTRHLGVAVMAHAACAATWLIVMDGFTPVV